MKKLYKIVIGLLVLTMAFTACAPAAAGTTSRTASASAPSREPTTTARTPTSVAAGWRAVGPSVASATPCAAAPTGFVPWASSSWPSTAPTAAPRPSTSTTSSTATSWPSCRSVASATWPATGASGAAPAPGARDTSGSTTRRSERLEEGEKSNIQYRTRNHQCPREEEEGRGLRPLVHLDIPGSASYDWLVT